ncbi:hypothetical protein RBB78_17070 [Tunturiibacter empetritectus]|uniref:hypothetical protein n=1 Tax=Tunturiibacter empetritectus TaxID=3069691 RepID=UPI003D9AB6CC
MARRLALAVGEALPAKVGWPVESTVRPVRVTGALAKEPLVMGRPPKRMVWSMVSC